METSALTFSQPLWFLGLLVVPAVAALYFWSQRRSDALVGKVVAPRLKAQLAGAVSVGRRAFKSVLILAVFALVAVALARPQMGFVQKEVKQRGRDVIIAVDTSRSMLATDVTPTRLARAKLVAQDLLRLVQGDRVGLVAFAGSAFLQAPLTLDYRAVLTSLDELDTSVIPKGGTNIAAAIATSAEAFGKGEGQTRALVILTDGEELDADGIAAARKAAAAGMRIFTVGVGSAEGSLIPLRGGRAATTEFVRDASGKPVQSRLDETRLKEIAEAGGGFYENLGPDTARNIFEKGILPLEEAVTGTMTSRQPVERYQWPATAAALLLALWLLIGDRKRSSSGAARKVAVAAGWMLLAGPAMAASGYDDYQAGNYEKAMADFDKRLESSPGSEKLQFDAGAASYKLGNYAKAVDHFTKALLTGDRKLREDASYNLGNSLVRRGEAARGSEEKKADWKNAIQHYTEALNLDAKNTRAKENRDIVKKMIEDLEKQEKQDQEKQDDQQQDQKDNKDQKDQQQNKDQQQPQDQKQDQKDKQDQQKSQDKQDQKDQQDGGKDEKKDDPEKQDQPPPDQGDRQKDDRQERADNNQSRKGDTQDQPPQPTPTPGEKKQGELKGNQDQQPQPASEGGGEEGAEAREKEGEMSAAQARSLLNSLRSDEERVKLMQRQETEDTIKDW